MSSILGNQTVKTLFQSKVETKPTVISQQSRIANIERIRILSAFGVVSFHTHDWFPRSIGMVGVIIFLLSFCAFVVNKPEPFSVAKVVRNKAQRILKPWLFWSLIYGILGLGKMFYEHLSFSEVFSPTMLLTGTRIHLWFLPFAFIAAVLLAFIHRKIVGLRDSYTILTAIFIGALCVFGCSIVQFHLYASTPLAQWIFGLPAIPLGFAIGRIKILPDAKVMKKYFVFLILMTLAATIGCVVYVRLSHGTWMDYSIIFVIRYLVSSLIFCAALYWRGKLDPISASLASLSYGIYLVHPLVLVPFYRFNIATQYPLLLFCLVLSISSLITFIIKKSPLKQFV